MLLQKPNIESKSKQWLLISFYFSIKKREGETCKSFTWCVFVMTHFEKILGGKTHSTATSRKFPFHGSGALTPTLSEGDRGSGGSGSGSAFQPGNCSPGGGQGFTLTRSYFSI